MIHQLPSNIWQREFLEFVQRRRALAIKMLFPLVVGGPLLLSKAPAFYAAMALTMLIAILGALGSGAVLARERSTGLTLRYRLIPSRPGVLLLQRLLADSAIDLLQLLPVLLLLALRHPRGVGWWPSLLLATAGSLLIGNVLGAWASTLTSSPGEVMLYVLLPLLPALYLSGVFVPPTDPVLGTLSRFLPFSYLHQALLAALGSTVALSSAVASLAGAGFILGAAAVALRLGQRVYP